MLPSSIVPQLLMWSLLTPHNLSLWYKSLSAVMILHYITACNSNHHQLYKVVKKKIVVKFYFNKHLNEVVGFYDYDKYINLITFYIMLELTNYIMRKNSQYIWFTHHNIPHLGCQVINMNTNVEAPLAKIESATPPVGGLG